MQYFAYPFNEEYDPKLFFAICRVLFSQLDHLVSYLRESNIMAYQEELVILVFSYFLPPHINGAEGMCQILPTGGVEVLGRFIEESDAGSDGLQRIQTKGNHCAHGLIAGQLIVTPLSGHTISQIT